MRIEYASGSRSSRCWRLRALRGTCVGTLLLAVATSIVGCGAGGQEVAVSQPSACESPDTKGLVTTIIEDNPNRTVDVRVLDMGNQVERFFDPVALARYCAADVVTNTGSTPISYKIYFGPSGRELIEVRAGADAYGASAMAVAASIAAQPPAANVPVPAAAEPAVGSVDSSGYQATGGDSTGVGGEPWDPEGSLGGIGGERGSYWRCPTVRAARSAIQTVPEEGTMSEEARYRALDARAAQLGCTTETQRLTPVTIYESVAFAFEEDGGANVVYAVTAQDGRNNQVAVLVEIAM